MPNDLWSIWTYFYLIGFKGLSANCPVDQWLEHKTVELKARARPECNNYPSIKFGIGDFVLLFLSLQQSK